MIIKNEEFGYSRDVVNEIYIESTDDLVLEYVLYTLIPITELYLTSPAGEYNLDSYHCHFEIRDNRNWRTPHFMIAGEYAGIYFEKKIIKEK